MKNIYHTFWEGPFCGIHLYAEGDTLIGLTFNSNDVGVRKRLGIREFQEGSSPVIKEAIKQLQEYFQGKRTNFTVKLLLKGSEFQMRTWEQLTRIPFGEWISYADQAHRMDHPKAMRAIGSANGKNPISILIPCHRVMGKNGTISGYAGGSDLKAKLLQLEGIQTASL